MPAVVASLVLGGAVGVATPASAERKPQPGLPLLDCLAKAPDQRIYSPGPEVANPCSPGPAGDDIVNFSSYYGTTQIGLTGATKAQQWSRIPLTMIAPNALFWYRTWPTNVRPGRKTSTEFSYHTRSFFVSPKGSDEDYGLSAPIIVRTIAFGAIPAEVTLQVEQAKDAAGLPEPIVANPVNWLTKPLPGQGVSEIAQIPSTDLNASVNIRVRKIVVDGRDIGLGTTCETGPTAQLKASSNAAEIPIPDGSDLDKQVNPNETFYGLAGGRLSGSISIPAFRGCGTRLGDDVSPLLTAALSSEDNPVTIQIGALACINFNKDGSDVPPEIDFPILPVLPGVNDPRDAKSNCVAAASPGNPYEGNENVKTVPDAFDIPDVPVEPVTDED